MLNLRGIHFLEDVGQDLHYGMRTLLKAPGFTLTAVLTLALGIGATTTMFSVVYNILFSPFTYREPDRISDLMIQDLENPHAGERGALIVPEFLDYLERSTVFQEVFGSNHGSVIDTSNKEGSEQLGVSWVTPNAFNFLGVAPILGRGITPDDGKPGAPPVAVLRYTFWINRFGGAADVLGKTLLLDGMLYTIIGVMPPRFTWDGPHVWIPSPLDRRDPNAATTFRWLHFRLKQGVSEQQAMAELIRTDLGISIKNLLVVDVMFSSSQYKTAAERNSFFGQTVARLAALPGVSGVAIANGLPPFGGPMSEIEISGRPRVEKSNAVVRLCGENYVQTIGLGLLSGRTLSESDIANARRVAVINRTLALRYFGNDDPLGKQISLPSLAAGANALVNPVFEVVGVVSDAKNRGLQESVQPEVLLPHTLTGRGGRLIILRSAGDPSRIVQSARQEIQAVDRGVPCSTIIMDNWLSTYTFAQPRFSLILLSIFAGLGLLMVSVGVYSVMNYAISLRMRELGIRMALGAERSDIILLVLRSCAKVLAIGIVLGLLVYLACGRLIADKLDLHAPYDPLVMMAGIMAIVMVGLSACWRPAYRASRVDPITVLRSE